MRKNRSNILVGLSVGVVMIGLFLVVISACSPNAGDTFSNVQSNFDGGGNSIPSPAPTQIAMEAPQAADGDFARRQPQALATGAPNDGVAVEQQDRVILRDANLSMTLPNVQGKLDEINGMVVSMGGWVVSSNTATVSRSDGEFLSATIVIRVPAERLDEAIEIIKSGEGAVVNREVVNGRDVTADYVDLTSRLGNLEAAEEQLQTILLDAENVEEVLAVYSELVRVRGDIETIRGRLNFYDEAAAFSSVTVTLNPPPPTVVEAQATGWNPGETVEGALGVLLGLVQFVVDAAITLAIIGLPLLLVVGIPAWLVWRGRRRSRVISSTS